jgi:hypothetical protein
MWRRVPDLLGVLSLCLMPQGAVADALTFEIVPSFDPSRSLSCRIEVTGGQIVAVQVAGTGMPPRTPMRWPVRRDEAAAVADALTALVAGDLTSVETYRSRRPPAPLITVTWGIRISGQVMSGLYIQSGLDLPPMLDRVIDTVLPGSACALAVD